MNSRTSPRASSGTNIHGVEHPPWASVAMRKLEHDIACAIQFDASVMISGESGAGKKYVAQLIHQRSAGDRAPFIIANCQDIIDSVFHESAGPGSVDQFKHGLLRTADNGTLLIEEIDKIPVPMQSQLLQFLESETTHGRDLRLMTATRTDLFARVRSSQFSEDLFYRLNRIHLVIPALRDRPEDIPILFRHYLSLYARAEVPRLSTAAWDRLAAYRWPGNVQELKTVTEKVAVQHLPRLVEPDDLPSHIGR
jgi:two-component system, NtrC family, response regulator AtoC